MVFAGLPLLGLGLLALFFSGRGFRMGSYVFTSCGAGFVLASLSLAVAGLLGRRAIDASTASVRPERIRLARRGVVFAWLFVGLGVLGAVATAAVVRDSGGQWFTLLFTSALVLPGTWGYAMGRALRAAMAPT
jgi:hypothetical protein